MDIKYSLDAKERIQKADYDNFDELVQSIEKNKLMSFVSKLPTVKGFRVGKDTEIRLKRFFGHCTSWNEEDWSLFLDLWLIYTESQTGLKSIIDFKNKEDLKKLVEELIKSDQKRKGVFENIVGNAQKENITQKNIKNWYYFSPLPTEVEIEKLLKFVPTENPVELKSRIVAIEEDLKAIKHETIDKSQFQLTNRSLNKMSTDLATYFKQMNKVMKDIEQNFNSITELEKARDSLNEDIEIQNNALSPLKAKLTSAINESNDIRNELKEVKSKIDDFALYEERNISNFKQIMDDFLHFDKKVEVLEQEIEAVKGQPVFTFNGKVDEKKHTEIKNVILTKDENPVKLKSNSDAATHLEKNLNQLGIKLSHARKLAREIIAALSSGQLVSLQGSLAYLIAERCASCLAGGEFKLIKIPFGCIDFSFQSVINDLKKESENSSKPIAVIIEGINRSAFEIYGESIKQFIIERMFQINKEFHSLFLFATVVEGPSVIPAGSELIEIGPLIYVDSLKWKDKAASKGIIGVLDKEIFNTDVNSLLQDYEWEESIVPDWLFTLGGPLWRKALILADAYGRELDPNITDNFEFAIFGWMAPMIIYLNSNKLAEFKEFVESDERLRFLMMKFAPGVIDPDEMAVYR